MRTTHSLFLVLSLFLSIASAQAFIDPNGREVTEIVQIFRELSLSPRPSLQEAAIQRHIRVLHGQMAKAGTSPWSAAGLPVPELIRDAIGNILIRLPGTGRYAGKELPYVGLQSHLDMVEAVAGLVPGQPTAPFFERGVKVVETDGVIHSEGSKTSLGADNGIGVAMMLRYLMSPEIEHPPLELVFTIDEESGFTGVRNFKLPLQSKALISLDHEECGEAAVGCQGLSAFQTFTPLDKRRIETDQRVIEISLSDLLSGHSGGEIGQGRAHAVEIFAAMAEKILAIGSGVTLSSLDAGLRGSAIPPSFTATFVYEGGLQKMKIEGFVEEVRAQLMANPIETPPGVTVPKWKLSSRVLPAGSQEWALKSAEAQKVVRVLKALPNGFVERGSVLEGTSILSNNVGVVHVGSQVAPSSPAVMTMALLPRSDTPGKTLQYVGELQSRILAILGPKTEFSGQESIEPWAPGPDNWLLRLISREFPGMKQIIAAGLGEPAVLAVLFPKVPMIMIGPKITGAHSPNERITRAAIAQAQMDLNRFLSTIPLDPGFIGCPALSRPAKRQ